MLYLFRLLTTVVLLGFGTFCFDIVGMLLGPLLFRDASAPRPPLGQADAFRLVLQIVAQLCLTDKGR